MRFGIFAMETFWLSVNLIYKLLWHVTTVFCRKLDREVGEDVMAVRKSRTCLLLSSVRTGSALELSDSLLHARINICENCCDSVTTVFELDDQPNVGFRQNPFRPVSSDVRSFRKYENYFKETVVWKSYEPLETLVTCHKSFYRNIGYRVGWSRSGPHMSKSHAYTTRRFTRTISTVHL